MIIQSIRLNAALHLKIEVQERKKEFPNIYGTVLFSYHKFLSWYRNVRNKINKFKEKRF
jgi:hypothetical protein